MWLVGHRGPRRYGEETASGKPPNKKSTQTETTKTRWDIQMNHWLTGQVNEEGAARQDLGEPAGTAVVAEDVCRI